jgi:hypothetical protein
MDLGSPDGSSQRLLADREDERADRLAYEQLKVRYSLSLADAWIAAATRFLKFGASKR